MIYVISKATFGSYYVRDIQCNANWDCCPYSDYALIPDNLVEGVLATQGYCDITLNADGTEVTGFTARSIPAVPEECCGTNTVLSVNGVKADTSGAVSLTPDNVGAAPAGYGLGANGAGATRYRQVNHEEADSLGATGIYWFVDNANPFYPDGWNSGTVGLLIHLQHNINNTVSAKQIFIPYYKCGVSDSAGSDNYVVVERTRRNKSGGGWTPIEWRNPPMQLGAEYRTTERYNGKPVYTMLVNCGTTAAGMTETKTTISDASYNVIRMHATKNGLPLPWINGSIDNGYTCYARVNTGDGYYWVQIWQGASSSSGQAYAQIFYCEK